ncbi:MAG: hypothetical protein ACLP4V_06185 [Methylocella sp.]
MKHGWIVLLAAVSVALGVIVWEFLPAIVFLVMFAMEPAGQGCDEGPVTDQRSTNGRGDVVEEYIKACTGFGTVVDYSIVLQLSGNEKTTTLVEHDRLYYEYPKFRWLNDDTLNIDLGKVEWISRKVDKVGSIHVTYSYTTTETSWW